MAGPWSFDGSFRRGWVSWRRNVPGPWIHPINFFQYVDVSGSDPNQYKLLKVRPSPVHPPSAHADAPPADRVQPPDLQHDGAVRSGVEGEEARPPPAAAGQRRRQLVDARAPARREAARPRPPARPAQRVVRRRALPARPRHAVRELDGLGHVLRLRPRHGPQPVGRALPRRAHHLRGARRSLRTRAGADAPAGSSRRRRRWRSTRGTTRCRARRRGSTASSGWAPPCATCCPATTARTRPRTCPRRRSRRSATSRASARSACSSRTPAGRSRATPCVVFGRRGRRC
jgi:hypothetical protein